MNIMENVRAVDATVLYYKNKWWMFANLLENDGTSTWDELFLFYADQPLSDSWKPHARNPVISDARRARPAGAIFGSGGVLYRPSQDNSRGYGYGLNLNRILVLNEKDYNEEVVSKIEPGWDRRFWGIHTFNQAGQMVVVDGKSRRFRYY